MPGEGDGLSPWDVATAGGTYGGENQRLPRDARPTATVSPTDSAPGDNTATDHVTVQHK